jgi:IclR family transcriptional regulator, KDG regulon repressor
MKPGSNGEAARRYRVPAAARVLALIEFLAAARTPMGVSETARQMGIPKSSCFALMTTLEQAGYVRRDERDEWTLTLRIYHVGVSAAKNVDIQASAQPVLSGLCAATGLTSHLGLFDGSSIIYALKVDPPGGMVRFDTYPGKHASPHLTAIGRAIAAAMSKSDLEGLLEGYQFAGGEHSKIRSRSRFMEELRRTRERGYAIEMEEETLGVACIAAPVTHSVAAAIGVAALAGQIKEKSIEAISAEVVAAADSLSALLGEHEPAG